jgi:hypothetical protein
LLTTLRRTRRVHHESDAIPVQKGVMGITEVNLPPQQARDITAERSMRSEVRLLGLWAHMHLLGTAMKLEVGPGWPDQGLFQQHKRNRHLWRELLQ